MSNLKSKSSKNIKYKSLEKSNDNLLFNNQNSLCLYIENNNNYGRYLLHDGSLYEGFIRKHKKGMIASGKGNFFMKEFLDDKGGDCYQIYSGNFENGKYHGYGEYYSYNKTNNIDYKHIRFIDSLNLCKKLLPDIKSYSLKNMTQKFKIKSGTS